MPAKMAKKQRSLQVKNSKGIFFWLLLASFLVSLVVSITALRNNNQTMARLRNAVYAADKAGTDVSGPLNDLRSYVYAHMNTNLSSGANAIKPPIQLKYTYERLEKEAEEKAGGANAQVYTDAQSYCQSLNSVDFSGRNRVPCVQDYVTSHGGAPIQTVPTALYQFDFVSPVWSPDLAGWSLLAALVFGILLACSLLIRLLAARKLSDT